MYIHPLSDVQTKNIGKGSFIWQYSILCEGVLIGQECNIGSHCYIEKNVKIGNRVTIKNGVYVFESITIGDDVFIGPNVTFTNDVYPRSRRGELRSQKTYPETIICNGASIGGGATILPGVTIGRNALIGAGAIVTKNVDDDAIVYGEQATLQGNINDKW
ncbi:N-acetyltransferase [bacterium]|nr:N-acetyltransferase [bacterium]